MSISIVIPAYNEEKNLPLIIGHLRKQTHGDFEIIVVDNNSSDNTYKVAKKLADRVCKCSEQGISPARNFGAQRAKYEIIAFLDADSKPFPKWSQTIIRHFKKNPNLGVVTGLDIYEHENELERLKLNVFSYSIFLYIKLMNSLGYSTVTGNNMAIKKDIFLKVGGFDKLIVEDYYLSLKLRKLSVRVKVDKKMKVELSSRRLKEGGFIKTLILWFTCTYKKISSDNYILHDNI